jgi:hypothetical protein
MIPSLPLPSACASQGARRGLPGAPHALGALACAAILALTGGPARAQDPGAAPAAPTRALDARTRLGFEDMHTPDGARVGMVGLTELVSIGGEWWFGPGVYGAVSGHRGGLFVPGVELAWSHPLNDWFGIDAGLFAGGGGGANAPVGGGLMLRPHLDLVFHPVEGIYTGPTWSMIRFVNGQIDSRQFGWMVNLSTSFHVRPADLIVPQAPTDGSATGLGFDRVDVTATQVHPRDTTHLSTGAPLAQTIGLVGMRAEHSFDDGPLWLGIEAAGAAKGGVAGYAEVLGTGGVHVPVAGNRLTFDLRASVGAGGGGDIDTGGGLLLKGAAGATLRLTDTLGVSVEGGLLHAPGGHFDGRQVSVALDWLLDPPDRSAADSWTSPGHAEATRMELATGLEHYDAARKDGRSAPLDAVMLQFNRFVWPNFYVTGQAHSAVAGGAGAYSVGLVGIGTQWPVFPRVRIGAEALAGAAGGGGVDTGNGAVAQARAYVDVALGETLSLRVGAGKVKALNGGLDAPVVDAALVFRFGVDRRR